MIPPFACCSGLEENGSARRRYQERKLRMLSAWRDGLERQMAAVSAAISTLERQMERDAATPGG
jgi:hypothetical protein